ncbi:MAG TPA: AAA domain-containing protein [Gemmatimonadota bacterium]|nr:AAA domain-containing protein [Gemmatimonadota bacterium]
MIHSESDHLHDLLAGCRSAVREEIDAVRADLERRGLGGPIPAASGTRAAGAGRTGPYEWTLPPGRYVIRADDAVTIETDGATALGVVVRFDAGRRVIRIATETALGSRPGPAELTFDPTWLLEALDDRLARMEDDPADYHVDTALRLFGRAFGETGEADVADGASVGLNPSQTAALRRVAGSRAQFVWGPPGTGKTRLLGHAGALLASEGRVLVAATTNAAVDEAAGRVVDVLGRGAVEANRVIRFGAGLTPESDPSLGVDAAVTRAEMLRPSALSRGIDELEERLGARRVPGEPIGVSMSRVQAAARRGAQPADEALAARLAAAYQAASRRALEGADVVLTTFARLAVRDELAGQRFDSLLIDEASAAPLPYVLFAAGLARHRAAAFGDFRQLPAVVMSRGAHAGRWLRRDVFEVSGVLEADTGLPSPRDRLCSMLEEQYRMRPAIRSLVGELFYGGRLRDAGVLDGDVDGGGEPGERAGELIMIDTASLEPEVERPDGSRRNEAHLETLLQVLEALARRGERDVAVVAPYRAQARELRRRVHSRLGRLAPADLEIATIHRFQGREKRVVVFDTVDAPPGRSWFLDERRNRDFPRMLNVALSRSRDMLIVVGTIEGLRRTLPPDALLNRVVERVCRDGVVLDAGRPGSFASLSVEMPV